MQHRTHIHAANDATAAFFLNIDSPLIDAVPHHDASLVGHIQRAAAAGFGIIFGVQVVFTGHGAGNAACIDIGVYLAKVHAVEHFTFGIAIGIAV